MEHRGQRRQFFGLKVTVSRDNVPIAVTRTANVSPHGMFLPLGDTNIGEGVPLVVEFCAPGQTAHEAYRVPVIVAHRSKHGIGVMYRSLAPDTSSALEATLVALEKQCWSPGAYEPESGVRAGAAGPGGEPEDVRSS